MLDKIQEMLWGKSRCTGFGEATGFYYYGKGGFGLKDGIKHKYTKTQES